ncbi:unnamed protein product [Oikopleura dioica]|uniref:G8 domain-containing protein n=1 Tax=Oikopleura dioica TaxID=34765 RepID=E4YBN7_OIKDI|nr:unnamed protein product [Oikopleura dioica]
MPLGDFDVFLQSLKFGKSSIISGPMKSFDIMVYPVINEVQKDKDNNLYLSGSGFENDCEFLVSNWPCIRDFTYELDSLSKMRCHVQQPRGLFDIPHFPSDLGMQIQLFDLQEFTQFPTWANILSFATEDRLVLEQQLSTMIFSWEQNVALVRSHGYFNPSFQKGSFRIDTIGLVLVRVSQCDPESGFCASPTTILDGHSSGEIYTDVHKFKKTSNYYLEIFVLRRSINGYTSKLSVQMISNDDSEQLSYEHAITEQVDLKFQRSGIFETVYLIKFKVDQPSNFEFVLKYGDRKTASFPLKGNTNSIQNELHLLSNTECKSLGNIQVVFHEDFESSKNHEVTGNVNPFCGLFALETKSPYLQKLHSSRVRSNTKLCFAFRGALENYATLNVEAKKGKSRKIYNIEIDLDNIDPTLIHENWRYQCQDIFNPVMEYIGQTQDSLFINNAVFHPTEKTSMFLDDIYLGESIGFFTRVQESIGARPSGEFVVHYGVTWKNANLGFDAQLQITIQSENCIDNIPPPEIDGKYDFTQIEEPFIRQYSKKGELIQIELQKSQYISSSESVTMQYGDISADIDLSQSDFLLTTEFEQQFGVIARVTTTGKCYDTGKFIRLESVDTSDLDGFRVDPANSVFLDIDVKVVRHGGSLEGLLSAKNMQMAAAHKAVFMKCPGNVFSECRANNRCDFYSLDNIQFKLDELEGSSEGSGEIQSVKFIQPSVNFESENKEDNFFSDSIEVDFGMPFLRRNDRCKIQEVFPQRFSLLGGVQLTISTKNCDSLESSASISVNKQNCKITSTSFDRVECFLKETQPGYAISMRSLESGWAPEKIKIPTGSKARWNWREMELPDGDDAQIRVQQTMTRGRVEHNRLGFISETGVFTFEREFLQSGHYFYSSGWIDKDQTLAFTGEIVVVDMLDAQISINYDNEEVTSVLKNVLQIVTVLDVTTEDERDYFVDGRKLFIHFNEIPESTGEIKVTLYNQLCENAVLLNSTTISCYFNLSGSPSIDCDLDVIFSDFGGIYYSKKVTSCPQIVPVVYNPIGNYGVGRKGGAEISINGNFKNFFGEDISVVAGTTGLENIEFKNSELKVLVPELEDGSYNLNVYYRNRWFQTFTLIVSEIFTSTLVQTEVQTSSQSHSIILTGFFVGDIESITVDEQPCNVKYSSASQIRCKISGIRAGSYIPKILMSLGYAAYEGKIADVSATILGVKMMDSITIVGEFFDATCGNQQVKIEGGNTTCVINECSGSFISCRLPPRSPGRKTLEVEHLANGLAKSSSIEIEYGLKINSVYPLTAGTNGGNTITIRGFGFDNESFTFENLDCADVKIVNTTISCYVASHLSMSSSPIRLISKNDGYVSFSMKRFEVIDNWSEQWTWGCTDIDPCKPVAGDLVEIPEGAKILLDESTPILKAILISGGILRIKDDDIALNVQYIIITNGGQLLVGSEQEPITSKIEINLHGDMSDHQLPLYGSKVIAVHDGKVEMYGQEKQSWTTLSKEASEGSTIIHVDDSSGWKEGDQLVIATTGGPDSHGESEKVKIVEFSEDNIRVNRKLKNTHTYYSVSVEKTGASVTLTAEVINLSRTIVIQGIIGEDKKFGGHLVAAQNAEKMILSYVEFKNVGQAFQLGRYPIHFHITGNEQKSKLIGCSIHRSFNRAVTFHAVHHLRAIGNVAYNIIGHAFFLEDGIETDNYLDSNVAIFTQQGTSLLNTDLWAAGFWITNPDNVLVGNRAVGGTHNGFWYNMPKRPTGPSFTKQICPRFTEMGRFEQNSAHSNGWFGLWIYPVYIPRKQSSCDVDEPILAEFRDSLFWNNERGAETVLTGLLKFSNMTVIRNRRAGLSAMEAYLPQWPALIFEDSTIIAHLDGEPCPNEHKPAVGLETPWKRGSFTADGLTFVNFNTEHCVAVDPCYKAYKHDCANTGRFSRTTFTNSTNKIVFSYANEYIIDDTDGSFMENNIPGKILPSSGILPKEKCMNQSEIAQTGVVPVWCDDSVVIRKFGVHKTDDAFFGSDLIVRTEHGDNRVPFRQLRFSHASGWIGFILGDSENMISFSGQNHTTANWTMNILDVESTDNMIVTGENYFGQQVQVNFPNLNQSVISDDLNFVVPSIDSLDEEIIVSSFTNASKSEEISKEDLNDLNFVDIMSLMSGDERKKIQFSSLNHEDGTDLVIGENEIVFLDSTVNARHVVIHGKLLLGEDVSEIEVNAEMIFVLGIFELNPTCTQRVTVALSGTWNSPTTEFGGYVGGSKVIYVAPTGEFVVNGCTTERKIHFSDKIASGTSNFTSLTVFPGDQLTFLPEILDPYQIENVIVTENENGSVKFAPALIYEHEFAVKTKSNLKFIGVDNSSFGGRILSRGSLKLANAEFVSFGQRGYNEVSDYRAAVSIDGYQASGKIVLCSFTKSHNSAIFVSNAPNVLLDRNVILDVISDGIRLNGRGNVALLGNIVANVKHPLLHPKSSTTGNKGFRLWPSGIRSDEAQGSSVSMIDNHVVCVEGFGFRTAGEKCNPEISCEASRFIPQTSIPNTVRGALHGVTVWGNSKDQCTAVSNFVVSNTVDYGIYVQTDASVQVENVSVRGSTAGISVLIYGANSRKHELLEKFVTLSSSTVILSEPVFNTTLEILNRTSSLRQKGTSNGGQIGIIIPTFSSEQNRAPIDEWSKVTSEPALLGGSCFSHVDIYAQSPRSNSVFICSNLEAKDFTHPIDLKNISFFDSTDSVVKVLIEKPQEEWITSGESADCIDMDCDGGKKVFVRDLDGSLSEDGVHERGVYFSQSEFAWGDQKRGVLDNRIPSSISLPDNENKRGITRSSANCTLVDDSWKCSGEDSNYGILIFESMDKDSTDRRLSPIVIRSSSGFVDMVNGPSNHRGSHGYAAISRISTFFFILRTGEEYEIAATSTLPKNFRLITTNFQSEGNILLHLATSNPQRMEIYRSGVFELPSNVKLNALGEMEFQLPNDSFIPKLDNFKNGENYFDRKTQQFHVGIKANTVLDVKTSSTILVSIGAVMEMTPIEFYAHKDLVYLLADFFELDSSQVKVVNVHEKAENSLTGRSNLLRSDEKEVEIEILPEVDSLSSVISTSTFCKVRQGFKNTFNSTINSFKAQKNEVDQLDPTISIFSVPSSLVDIGSKNYTSALRQPMNLTIKIIDAENKFIDNGDFSIRVTMKKLDSLDSRLEKSVALMMANALTTDSVPGFETGEPLSKLERKTLQRWNNKIQHQSENPVSNVVFKKKWKKNKANKSEKKAKKANKKKNKQTSDSKIPAAPAKNKKPWANKWNSNKKKPATAKPTTRPQSSTYSVENGPKIVLDNIVHFVNGSFFIDIPTKYSGLYSLEIDFIENENCHSDDDKSIKMSINLEVLKSKNGAGQVCDWENRVLICSGKELEALDGFFEIMKLSNMFVTNSGNIPLDLIQTVDLSNNELYDAENLAEFVDFFENIDKLILDDNLFTDLALFKIEKSAPTLSTLSLKNNKISSLSNSSLFANLKELDVSFQTPSLQCVAPAALSGKAKVIV